MARSDPMNAAVLLVEDDPVSAAFLHAASQSVAMRVDVATSLAEAMQLAAAMDHAAWMIDANLPDGSGIDLLQRLRDVAPTTPAMAHTACALPDTATRLQQAGFAHVLVKPIGVAQWQAALRDLLHGNPQTHPSDALPEPGAEGMPIWDDARASRALGGQLANVQALRRLFVEELPKQRDAIRLGGESERRQHLHRLRASCALVGAARLDVDAAALHDRPGDAQLLQQFLHTADATLAHPFDG